MSNEMMKRESSQGIQTGERVRGGDLRGSSVSGKIAGRFPGLIVADKLSNIASCIEGAEGDRKHINELPPFTVHVKTPF